MKKVVRDKKFIGAAIGAAANITGSVIGAVKKKKAMQEQEKAEQAQRQLQLAAETQQQAAAMSSSYANQDYVDEVKNKISLRNGGKVKGKDRIKYAKKYALGGRGKKLLGMNDNTKRIGNNISQTFGNATANTINTINTNRNNISPNINLPTLTTANNIERNKDIARKANDNKIKSPTIMEEGGQQKGKFSMDDFMGETGNAIGGIKNLVTGIASPTSNIKKPRLINAGYSYEAPKTGLSKNSYSVDANGNTINTTTNAGINNAININDNQYRDRLSVAKMGIRKRKK